MKALGYLCAGMLILGIVGQVVQLIVFAIAVLFLIALIIRPVEVAGVLVWLSVMAALKHLPLIAAIASGFVLICWCWGWWIARKH